MLQIIQDKLKIIITLLIIIFSAFCLTACFGDGTSSTASNGSSSSSSGSQEQQNQDDGKEAISSHNEDDFFSGVLVAYDAGYSGKFYDVPTDSTKTFTELLDREITTFTTHLIYALNVLYGDNSNVTSESNATFNLLNANSELAGMWGSIDSLDVKPSTLLSIDKRTDKRYLLNTSDFENNKQELARSITAVANLGEDNNKQGLQFNFDRAIEGGFTYYHDAEFEGYNKGYFTEDINTNYRWTMNISSNGEFYNSTIRDAIANILANQSFDQGVSNKSYEEALKDIEYLGFSPSDQSNITQYILSSVIGSAYNYDEAIMRRISTTYIDCSVMHDDEDKFPTDINIHYYKAYDFTVKILVERMAQITIDGIYTLDEEYDPNSEHGRTFFYPIMPRTSIDIMRCSEIFSKTNNINFDDDGNFDINKFLEEYDENKDITPLLTDIKLKQIIFIPKLSKSVKDEYLDNLKEKYGNNYLQYSDLRFVIESMNIGVNATTSADESEFILLPVFTIVADDGEDVYVYQGNVNNEVSGVGSSKPDICYDEYALCIDNLEFDVNEDEASYTIKDVMGTSKFDDYEGVELFDEDDKPNQTYFHSDAEGNYLIVDMAASYTFDDTVYKVTIDEEKNTFIFTFNGKVNFLQIDFLYYDINAQDIYNSNAGAIEPQSMDLFILSIWT